MISHFPSISIEIIIFSSVSNSMFNRVITPGIKFNSKSILPCSLKSFDFPVFCFHHFYQIGNRPGD